MAKLVRERSMIRRKSHLGVSDELYRLVMVVEILGGVGLLLAAVNGPENGWPALFHVAAFGWIGLVSALALMAIMIGAVVYHRRALDELNDYIPAMAMALLCVAYLIALGARAAVGAR
jgi:hypothetical protein